MKQVIQILSYTIKTEIMTISCVIFPFRQFITKFDFYQILHNLVIIYFILCEIQMNFLKNLTTYLYF